MTDAEVPEYCFPTTHSSLCHQDKEKFPWKISEKNQCVCVCVCVCVCICIPVSVVRTVAGMSVAVCLHHSLQVELS